MFRTNPNYYIPKSRILYSAIFKPIKIVSPNAITKHNTFVPKSFIADVNNYCYGFGIKEDKIRHVQSLYKDILVHGQEYYDLLNWFEYRQSFDHTNLEYEPYKYPCYTTDNDTFNRSIVNSIIFGKSCLLSVHDLDRILPFVKVKMSNVCLTPEVLQIDNYVIKSNKGSNTHLYTVDFRSDNIDDLHHVKNDYEKLIVVRGMLRVMNELEDTVFNKVNYKTLLFFEHQMNWLIQKTHTRVLNNEK